MLALTWVSAGTSVVTQARAVRSRVEALTAKSRRPMAVVVEITPNAAAPVLDHCDQLDGILPSGVELNVSVNQGEADGAVRASKISRRGTMREADFRFMTGLVLGAGTLSRRTKFDSIL